MGHDRRVAALGRACQKLPRSIFKSCCYFPLLLYYFYYYLRV